MTARPVHLLVRLFLAASAALWPAAPVAQQTPAPTFRGGIDLVRLDVLVLDRNRRPVRGLTPADFTVLEDSRPQPILTFTEVHVPPVPVAAGAEWTRTVDADVTSNDVSAQRLVVILLDDALTGFDEGEPRLVREIGQRVVDELGPSDLAAVVFTSGGRAQNFTNRRAELRAAIESFRPKRSEKMGVPLGCTLKVGGCTVNALAGIGDVLRGAAPGRKAIFYVGPGPVMDTTMADPDGPALPTIVRDMLDRLQQANTSIYSFDPRGLRVAGGVSASEIALPESTGGRRVQHTNAPGGVVPEIFAENSSYYLIGFRASDRPADARFRPLRVVVNRPGVTVQTRSGYFPQRREAARPPIAPLDAAVLRGLPSGDLPLRVSTAAFGHPGRREADLVIVASLRDPNDSQPAGFASTPSVRRVETVAAVFDAEWRSHGAFRQTVEVTIRPEGGPAEYELIARFRLAPGRYEIRFGAESEGRAGSVFTSADVPDFSGDELSMSGVLLERTPARPIAPSGAVADLAPIVPTSVRDLTGAQRLSAFVKVYQGRRSPAAVTVRARLLDAADRVIADEVRAFEGRLFAGGQGVPFQWETTTSTLAPGLYLLRFEATVAGRTVTRDVRLSVGSQ